MEAACDGSVWEQIASKQERIWGCPNDSVTLVDVAGDGEPSGENCHEAWKVLGVSEGQGKGSKVVEGGTGELWGYSKNSIPLVHPAKNGVTMGKDHHEAWKDVRVPNGFSHTH